MWRTAGQRLGRAALMLLFGAGLIGPAIARFNLSPRLLGFAVAPVTTALTLSVIGLAALALVLPLRRRGADRWSRLAAWAGVAALVLVVPFNFLAVNFGQSDLEMVVIALSDNGTGDLVDVAFQDFAKPLVEAVAVAILLPLLAWYLLRRMPGFVPLLLAVALFAILTSEPVVYLWRLAFPDPAIGMVTLADLVPPEVTAVPPGKPNIVIVYLESLERSYRDIPAARDAFAPLAALEDRGFSARNVGQVEGTHFSVAGLVASQCGVPLVPRGLTNATRFGTGTDLRRARGQDFLPGVDCLGDVLAGQGYAGAYLSGSSTDIFAITNFLATHGFTTIRGLTGEADYARVPRSSAWAVPDATLFAAAQGEIGRLAAGGKPFFLLLFTASTHGPRGYPDPDCRYAPPVPPEVSDSPLPAAIRCSGELVQGLLDDLETRGLGRNTVVVVMNDHFAFPNSMKNELNAAGDARRNLFVILNSPTGIDGVISERAATMLDLFPTMIEALGFTLRGGAGNLGRSLLSGNATLAERLGFDILDRALFRNRALRRYVWSAGRRVAGP